MAVEDVSIETGKTKTFSALDYVIFAAILVISASIGFYNAWKDRRDLTLKNFLLAGGNMQLLPVALSLLASFMSAITLLGTPVEMYIYSTMYFYIGIGYFFVMAGAAHIYVPIFYRLRITSVYEYLERRWSKMVRTAGSLTFCIQMLLYMAIVLYAPSLALNQVTGFTLWGAVVSVGTVCTIYTAFGGMKAVLWTDCFQVGMMMAGLLAVLIRGSMAVGGFAAAWEKMESSGRVFFDDFRPDPGVRHSFWSCVVGGYFTWVAIYGVNQAQVQRASTCPTLRRAQMALWLNVPGLWIILYLGCMIGVVVYAFYSECDPIGSGFIAAKDQILPLFVMDVLGDVTGLPGLFVACLFSGALSTISSGLNSMAAVILEDVVKAYIKPDISELRATRLTQMFALVLGMVCLALTYVASLMGNVLQAALSLFGMIAGPLLGLFTMGMVFPWANKWGAISGLLTSLAFMFWIGVGAFIEKPPVDPTPPTLSTAGCLFNRNMTTVAPTTTLAAVTTTTERSPVYLLYTLSYIWYGFYAVITVNVVGLLVSFATGYTKASEVDPKLMCPIFDIIPPFCFLPEAIRKPLRMGVVHKGKYDDVTTDAERVKTIDDLEKKKVRDIFEHEVVVSPVKPSENGSVDKSGEKYRLYKNGVVNPAATSEDEETGVQVTKM